VIIFSCFIFCGFVFAQTPDEEKSEKSTQEEKNPKLKVQEKKKLKAAKTDASKKQKDAESEKKESIEVPEDLGDPFEEYFPKPGVTESSVVVPDQFLGPLGSDMNIKTYEDKPFDTSSLKVTGIVWGGDKPKAIIDDKIYGKGDVVNEAEIISITKEGILFKYYDKEYLMKREGLSAESSGKGGSNE
jgi:hypothetical protein